MRPKVYDVWKIDCDMRAIASENRQPMLLTAAEAMKEELCAARTAEQKAHGLHYVIQETAASKASKSKRGFPKHDLSKHKG